MHDGAQRSRQLAAAVGAILLIAALAAGSGWLLRPEHSGPAFFGYPAAPGTVFGFVLAGIALLGSLLADPPRARMQAVSGGLLAVLSALLLAQQLFGTSSGPGPGAPFSPLPDAGPSLAQPPLIDCLAFLAMGLALATGARVNGPAAALAARSLAAAVAVLGAIAFIGRLLDFDPIFDIELFSEVSPPAAAGFIAAASALWLGWRGTHRVQPLLLRGEDLRITSSGALIAAAVATAAGVSAMAIMQRATERTLADGLLVAHRNRATLLAHSIEHLSAAIDRIAASPEVIRLHSELMLEPGSEDPSAYLHTIAQSNVRDGLSFVEFRDPGGRRIASDGRPSRSGEIFAVLAGKRQRALIWDEGLALRAEIPIRNGEVTVGSVLAEAALEELKKAVFDVSALGATGEIGVCVAQDRETMNCLPLRFNPRLARYSRQVRGLPLPMSLALDGESGIIRTRDYRNREVIAAYGPVADLGLGMVIKVDTAELYAPVRNNLVVALALILLLLAAGTGLLFVRVRPLARRLVASQEELRRSEERLAFERNLLRAVIDNLPDAVFAKDRSLRYLVNNKASQSLLGVSSEAEATGRKAADFFPPELARMIEEEDEKVIRDGEPVVNRERCISAGGRERWVLATKVPLRDNEGTIIGMVGISRDITQQRQAERALRMREQQLALALDSAHLALWDYDVESGGIYLSEQWNAIRGGPPESVFTTIAELEKLVHPDDVPALRKHLNEVWTDQAQRYDIEHRILTHGGAWKWIHSQGKVIERDAGGRARRMIGVNADIDRRKRAELLLEHQAGHDALTGLPNRRLFHDRLARAMARTRRRAGLMALLYLDIDRFKSINDTLGHDAGDALLVAFSRRLVECVRETDTVARLGGDEFTVILEELNGREDGCQIAAKIVAAMRPEFVLDGHTVSISTSVGVAFHHGQEAIAMEDLLKRADEALYQAKAAGRDQYRVAA